MTAGTIAVLILLFAASVEFVLRGPRRALLDSGDMVPVYLASGAWVDGANPFAHDELERRWKERAPGEEPHPMTTWSVYPPTTLALMAPVALLPWQTARPVVLGANLILVAASLVALISAAGLRPFERRTGVFVGMVLALAPLHTGLAKGNLTVPAAACLLLAFGEGARKHQVSAGILLGVATALKPQIGGVLLLYYALHRQWWICGAATIVVLLLTTVAISQLGLQQMDWLRDWRSNTAALFAPGGLNDPTRHNPFRHYLMFLQWPLHTVIAASWLVNWIAWGYVGALLMLYARAERRPGAESRQLLSLSALLVISLLPLYHRVYDAVLVILPLLWSITAFHGKNRRMAAAVFILLLPLLWPGAPALHAFLSRGLLPPRLASEWWWNTVVMPHQIWALAVLALGLIYVLSRESRSNGQPAEGPSPASSP